MMDRQELHQIISSYSLRECFAALMIVPGAVDEFEQEIKNINDPVRVLSLARDAVKRALDKEILPN